MPSDTTLTVRLSDDVREKLEALSRTTRRSRDSLAAEAIAAYVDSNVSQVDSIKRAVAEARQPDAQFVPHEEVEAWIDSLRTDNPLPKARGRLRSEL